MRRKISAETWAQVDTAIAAGIGAREIGRNMGIPEGTVLAHVKRKGVRHQIAIARAAAQPVQARESSAITPLQSAAVTMQQRGQRYAERMAGVSERVLPHLEAMEPDKILDSARNIEQLDRVARRTYGLDDQKPNNSVINLELLTGQAFVQVINPPA